MRERRRNKEAGSKRIGQGIDDKTTGWGRRRRRQESWRSRGSAQEGDDDGGDYRGDGKEEDK